VKGLFFFYLFFFFFVWVSFDGWFCETSPAPKKGKRFLFSLFSAFFTGGGVVFGVLRAATGSVLQEWWFFRFFSSFGVFFVFSCAETVFLYVKVTAFVFGGRVPPQVCLLILFFFTLVFPLIVFFSFFPFACLCASPNHLLRFFKPSVCRESSHVSSCPSC